MKRLIYIIVYFPFVISYLLKGRFSKLILEDITAAQQNSHYFSTNHTFSSFINFIVHHPEWRMLYIFRIGGFWRTMLRYIYHNRINFYLQIGGEMKGGFFPQHAWSTIVLAEKIGRNCQVWQNVTIGKKYSGGGIPIIGDNVKVCAGACVLGNIKIGNNVIIGANAVVLKDIPDNCVAVGVPAVIKYKHTESNKTDNHA